jgi:hypothetical protein
MFLHVTKSLFLVLLQRQRLKTNCLQSEETQITISEVVFLQSQLAFSKFIFLAITTK